MWIRYGELYEVNGYTGEIRNGKTGYVLKPYLGVKGRFQVYIYGKKQDLSRVIGLAIFPRIIREGDEVDHLNRNKIDNRPCNLQWKSSSANKRNNAARNINIFKSYYVVKFTKDRRPIYYKYFKSMEEAIEARDAFKSSQEFRNCL